MVQTKYYKCFSFNLKRFLSANGVKYMSKGTHENGNTFYVYKVTEELSRLLTIWSDNK